MIVAPSILTVSKEQAPNTIDQLIKAGADWIHWDVMDGIFVPNVSYTAADIRANRSKSIVFDVHLMIANPKQQIAEFAKCGADYLTFHYEATDNPLALIQQIKSYGIHAGISIKPNTPVEVLLPLLSEVDLILVMSVEPGFGGQKFMDSALAKIRRLYCEKMANRYDYLIEVDGGINDLTAQLVAEVGCEIVVAGSYIINSSDYKQTIAKLQKY